MKHKFQFFHLPVFIAVLVGLTLTLVLNFTQPRDSLLDYALTLDDGQFVSDSGFIYEQAVDYPSGLVYVKRIGEVSGHRFRVSFGSTPAKELLPHEFGMQMTDYGSLYIASDGSVWQDTHEEYGDDDALLIRYLTPAAVLDTSDAVELNIYDGDLRHEYITDEIGRQLPNKNYYFRYYCLRLTYATIHNSPSANICTNSFESEFAVRLKDGWYAVASQPGDQSIYLPNIGFDTKASALCRLAIYDAVTDEAFAYNEFDMHIRDHRIHISDTVPQTYDLS